MGLIEEFSFTPSSDKTVNYLKNEGDLKGRLITLLSNGTYEY